MALLLTDPQQVMVLNATRPLEPVQQLVFLSALLELFADRSRVEDGELFRALRDLQLRHCDYPRETLTQSHRLPVVRDDADY